MTEEQAKESNNSGISRRKFIQGTTTGVALVAGGALLGSAIPAAAAQATKSAGLLPATPAGTSTPVQGSSPPTTWDQSYDVVVVGAAGAGMCAAIEAATAGSNTVIIEKMPWWGGLYTMAGGSSTFGGNNHIQQRDGIKGDSIEAWYATEMKGDDWRAPPEIVRTYVENADNWLYWIESLGGVWATTTQGIYPDGPPRGMSLATSANYPPTNQTPWGYTFVYFFKQRLDALKVPILLQYAMTGIYREPNGPVVGVAVSTPTGPMNFKANKAVVIATGGTSDNTVLLHAYDPRYDNDMYHDGLRPPGLPDAWQNTGDGHLAAQAIGAGLTDMSYAGYVALRWGTHLYYAFEPRPADWWDGSKNMNINKSLYLGSAGLSISDYQQVIIVKNDGTRFVDELAASATTLMKGSDVAASVDPYAPYPLVSSGECMDDQFTRAWLNLPDRPRNCWAVADANGAKTLSWNTGLFASPDPQTSPYLYPDAVATANDLPTLAALMGVSATGLKNTVASYNSYVTSGTDPDFGKATPKVQIQTPPYYAAKWCVLRHTQRNGIRVNSRAQVIDQIASQWGVDQGVGYMALSIDQEPVIPHLYAAGEVAAIYGQRRFHNTLYGYGIFGRIAGQNAAAEPSMA